MRGAASSSDHLNVNSLIWPAAQVVQPHRDHRHRLRGYRCPRRWTPAAPLPRLRVVRSHSVPLSGNADEPRWSHGQFIGPRDDLASAVMLAAGWVLFAAGMWLFGQRGLGFDQPPDLGPNRWLIVALLCLATVLSARWAIRLG